jgi:arylsulfatase A-like enzyme
LDEENLSEKDKTLVSILYDAEILYCDHYIGIFFNYLKKKRIFHNTCIVLTSDHGEALWEHNFTGHHPYLYDELLRIPLILKLPMLHNNKKLIKKQVELIDLAPTIMNVYEIPEIKQFMGTSLIPLINGEEIYNHPEHALSATYQKNNKSFHGLVEHLKDWKLLISVRNIYWKLIYSEQTQKFKLFNLKKDPKELNDLNNINNKSISLIKSKLKKLIMSFIEKKSSEKAKIKSSIKRFQKLS